MKRKIVTQEMIYAYKYILFFAKNKNKIETKKKIADSEKLPLNFITKITAKLKQAGILNSFPGQSGGNNLSKSLEEISIYDLIAALHGDNYLEKSFENKEESFIGIEEINLFFNSLQKEITKKLKTTTLAKVINNTDHTYFEIFEPYDSSKSLEQNKIKNVKEQAKKEQIKEMAKNLLDILSVEIISKKTGLTLEEIETLKSSKAK